jgi:hypothetical protein
MNSLEFLDWINEIGTKKALYYAAAIGLFSAGVTLSIVYYVTRR